MTSTADHVIYNMGDLLGEGDINLGGWGIPFTVFIVIGVTNALNMSDGIDGLAGGVSLISFLSMYYLAMDAGWVVESQILLIFIAILIPFLLLNAPFFGKRSARLFMGDAGSMFLGFALAWYITVLSQGEKAVISPVITLWIFAIPLLDTVSIMVRRMVKGRSPFSPDRDHFHHIFQAAGYSNRKTLIIILLTQVVLSSIGIAGHKAGVPDWVMFWGFFILQVLFFWAIKRAWYVMRVLRHIGGGAS
jgi:UDP-GlcNAc:undecaprenyl-phosphate GlcNAc-1-phosphate transferase